MGIIGLTADERSRFSRLGLVAPGGVLGLADTIDSLSPTHWWKMNDASGALVNYGSEANTAAAVSGPTYRYAAGPDGDSYSRLVSGAYFQVADASTLGISNPSVGMTVCCAFKPEGFSGINLSLFGKLRTSRDWGLFCQGTSDDNLLANWYQDGSTSAYRGATLGYAIAVGKWHFVIVTFKSDQDNGLFFDTDVADTSNVAGPTGTGASNGTEPLSIGRLPAFGGYQMNGQMAHVAIWQTCLSGTDITTLMTTATREGWTP